jgi:hypothetical protein
LPIKSWTRREPGDQAVGLVEQKGKVPSSSWRVRAKPAISMGVLGSSKAVLLGVIYVSAS